MIRISVNKSYGSRGISFFSLLAITFVVLKLLGYIDWSWWWVLSPVWITFTIAFIVISTVSILVAIAESDNK